MKKFGTILVCTLATICLCMGLAACSGNVTGVYEGSFTQSAGGFSVTMTMSIELKKDNTCTVKTTSKVGEAEGELMTVEGTYKVDGKKLSITVQGDTQEFTIDGKKITASQDGVSFELTKK